MNTEAIKIWLYTILIICTMSACFSGNSQYAEGGIGGSGISSGPVSGFGSIFVNGIKYDMTSADIVMNGRTASEGDLEIGMLVNVKGNINHENNSGVAQHVEFNYNLVGTLETIDIENGRLQVEGETVHIDPLTIIHNAVVNDLIIGTRIHVNGIPNNNGELIARFIFSGESNLPSNTLVLEGKILAVNSVSSIFTLGTKLIDYSSATFDAPTETTLTINNRVRLEGEIVENIVIASKIELISTPIQFSGEEIQEVIINGNTVKVSEDTEIINETSSEFANVEVVGEVDAQGVIVADTITYLLDEENDTHIVGEVNAVDGWNITISGVSTTFASNTYIIDSSSEALRPFSVEDINVGDKLEIYGYSDGATEIILTKLDRLEVALSSAIGNDTLTYEDTLLQGSVGQPSVTLTNDKLRHSYTRAVARDDNNNVYILGDFTGLVDFDPGTGVDEQGDINSSISNIYLTRISDGAYEWTKVFTSLGNAYAKDIAIDPTGNVYIAGNFTNDLQLSTQPNITISSNGNKDVFIARLNNDLQGTVAWAYNIGGIHQDDIEGLALTSDRLIATGSFGGEVTFGANDTFTSAAYDPESSSEPESDIYVITLDQLDGNYIRTLTLGGNYDDNSYDVSINNGRAYLVGAFAGTVDFAKDTGSEDSHTSGGSQSGFLTQFNIGTDTVLSYGWTRIMSGDGSTFSARAEVQSIVTDTNGIYITGNFRSQIAFDDGSDIKESLDDEITKGRTDIFVSHYKENRDYGWTYTAGGVGSDHSNSIITDHNGNVFVAGGFTQTVDFSRNSSTGSEPESIFQTNNYSDAFYMHLTKDGNYLWTQTIKTLYIDQIHHLSFDNCKRLYFAGVVGDVNGSGNIVYNDVDFDPTDNIDARIINHADAFLTTVRLETDVCL